MGQDIETTKTSRKRLRVTTRLFSLFVRDPRTVDFREHTFWWVLLEQNHLVVRKTFLNFVKGFLVEVTPVPSLLLSLILTSDFGMSTLTN